jgi:hypothetical protein
LASLKKVPAVLRSLLLASTPDWPLLPAALLPVPELLLLGLPVLGLSAVVVPLLHASAMFVSCGGVQWLLPIGRPLLRQQR